MQHLATTRWLAAAFLLLALPGAVQAQDLRTLDTGDVQFDVYDNGFLGAGATPPLGTPGFSFGGADGLFEGQLIVGRSATELCGEAYAGSADQEPFNWVNTSPFATLTPPFPAPYEPFDEGYDVSFDCSGDTTTPLPGIAVRELSYSREGDPFVVFEFEIMNTGSSDLTGVYAGVFADFDVDAGAFAQNLGAFEDDLNLLYVWDPTGATAQHFGMMVLNAGENGTPVVAAEFDLGTPLQGGNPPPDSLFSSLSGGSGGIEDDPTVGADRRTVIGTGPYTIPAGGSASLQIAFVAANTASGIVGNAEDAEALVGPIVNAIEPGPDGTPGTHGLSPVYPNPFRGQARFTLEVAQTQAVRVAVYDALGREVALLHDGTLAAGAEHTLSLDAAALPSGVYLVRVVGEQFSDLRQVTLTR